VIQYNKLNIRSGLAVFGHETKSRMFDRFLERAETILLLQIFMKDYHNCNEHNLFNILVHITSCMPVATSHINQNVG